MPGTRPMPLERQENAVIGKGTSGELHCSTYEMCMGVIIRHFGRLMFGGRGFFPSRMGMSFHEEPREEWLGMNLHVQRLPHQNSDRGNNKVLMAQAGIKAMKWTPDEAVGSSSGGGANVSGAP